MTEDAVEPRKPTITVTQEFYKHAVSKLKQANVKLPLDENTFVSRDPQRHRDLIISDSNGIYAKVLCPCGGARAMDFFGTRFTTLEQRGDEARRLLVLIESHVA